MKKLVLKIDMLDDGAKRKAMKTVAGLQGIDSISIDMKERKLTIIGTVDPTRVVSRLRKFWRTELLTVGPAKEEPKKEEAKKEVVAGENKPVNEAKKDGAGEEKKTAEEPKTGKENGGEKKEGDDADAVKTNTKILVAVGGEDGGKKEEEKKVDPVLEMVKAYRAYNPQMTKNYYVQSMEENPNACVIC